MLQEYEVLSLVDFNGFAHKRNKMPKHLFSKSKAKKSHSLEWLFLCVWSGKRDDQTHFISLKRLLFSLKKRRLDGLILYRFAAAGNSSRQPCLRRVSVRSERAVRGHRQRILKKSLGMKKCGGRPAKAKRTPRIRL